MLLSSQHDFRSLQRLPFCYLCGHKFDSAEAVNRDHVPPSAIFATDDREPALILPTHALCNELRSGEDQLSAQLVGAIYGREEDARHFKLDLISGRFKDGTPFAAAQNLNLKPIIKRWVAGFHAALYLEPLPLGTRWSTQMPLPDAIVEPNGLKATPIGEAALKFIEELKRNRRVGTIDSIVCRNRKCVYECVWTQFDNGQWFCLFCLDLYDRISLGDSNKFVQRGCVGSYILPQVGIPVGATVATRLIFDVENRSPLDPFLRSAVRVRNGNDCR
jgi:hypothetical protein